MMALTHIGFGAASGAIFAQAIGASSHVWLIAGALVGSLAPDIDHPKSWLGRRLPFISIPLSGLVGHRGVTHSLIGLNVVFAAVLLLAWYYGLSGEVGQAITGFGIGYASHLFADWLSNSGIPLLWPNRQRFAAPVTLETGSAMEHLLSLAIWGGLLAKVSR
jgi:inner membrane protein